MTAGKPSQSGEEILILDENVKNGVDTDAIVDYNDAETTTEASTSTPGVNVIKLFLAKKLERLL